jgi:hypothetical protein
MQLSATDSGSHHAPCGNCIHWQSSHVPNAVVKPDKHNLGFPSLPPPPTHTHTHVMVTTHSLSPSFVIARVPHLISCIYCSYLTPSNHPSRDDQVTLPHKKYYNLEGWEAKQMSKRKADFDDAAAAAPVSLVGDEQDIKARNVKKSKMGMSQQELLEMKKIMRERAEAAMRKDLGLKVDDKAGVRTQTMLRGETVGRGLKTV